MLSRKEEGVQSAKDRVMRERESSCAQKKGARKRDEVDRRGMH